MSGQPDRRNRPVDRRDTRPSPDAGRTAWLWAAAGGALVGGIVAVALVAMRGAAPGPVSADVQAVESAPPSAVASSGPTAPPARATRPPIEAASEADLPERWAPRATGSAGAPPTAPESAPAPKTGPQTAPESAPASAPAPATRAEAAPAESTAERLKLARAALQSGALDDAAATLRSIPADAPEAPEAAYLLGETAHRRGDLAQARSHFADAARRGGRTGADAARVLNLLGQADDVSASGELERSNHFVLRVPANSRGGTITRTVDVLRTLEQALDRILRDLPTVPDREIPVFVLSVDEFKQRFPASPGTVLYGVYLPGERSIYVNDALGNAADRNGRDTLAHELTHALVDRTTAGRTPAVWLNEGLARYQGRRSVDLEPVSAAEWAELKARAKNGTLPGLSTVRHGLGQGLIAYRLGAAACVFIGQRFGLHHIVQYFDALRGGSNHDAAFRVAFNGDEARFEADLREWLKSR